MSISLKNIDDRVRALESKINTGKFTDTGWINGILDPNMTDRTDVHNTPNGIKYRVMNGVIYILITCVVKSTNSNIVFAKLPNWNYGEMLFSCNGTGDKGGHFEGKLFKVDANGNVKTFDWGIQWRWFNWSLGIAPINL